MDTIVACKIVWRNEQGRLMAESIEVSNPKTLIKFFNTLVQRDQWIIEEGDKIEIVPDYKGDYHGA